MKNSIWKRLLALGVCCLMATSVAFAAGVVSKQVTIQYMGIKLVVDSVEVTPKDANGTVIEPLVYNGTTYLPLRAVGDAIGKQVTWDGNSKTVYLGEAPNARKWLMDLCPPYEGKDFHTDSTFKMAGKTYTHGFSIGYYNSYGLFNLNGQYHTLSCDIGHLDGYASRNSQVEIYLDGDLSQVIEVPADALVTHFDIPLHNALQMKIVSNGYEGYAVGFANCELS